MVIKIKGMYKKSNAICIALLIGIMITLYSCNRFHSTLTKAETLMEEHPDSALTLLRGIKNPEELSERNYAFYALLVTQAMDKNNLDLTKDTLSDDAVHYFSQSKDSIHAAKAYFYSGRVNEKMKNADQAIACYLKAKDFSKGSKEYKFQYLIRYYLGNLYLMQDLDKDGINAYKEAYRYAFILKNNTYRCLSLSKIGFGYSILEEEDSALNYQFRALKIAEKSYKSYTSTIYNYISEIYSRTGKYKLALHYYNKAFASKQQEDDLYTLYSSKGEIYADMHQYDSAVYYLNKSLKSSFIYTKASGYSLLAKTYEAQGKIDKALYCKNQFNLYRDTIDTQTQSAAIIEMQEIYKHSKLKEENLLLKQKEEEKNKSFYRLSLFASLLFLIGGCAYLVTYKKSQKRKEQILLDQEVLQKEKIEELEKEKEQIQKETELRADFYRQLNLVVIPELRNTMNEKAGAESKHIKLTEKDWDRIIENTDVAFSHFTKRLKEAYPQMTTIDIRFCCLIKMQLKQSEIADILNMEKISVKRRKLRIRKDKMMLDDGRILDEIIRNF